VAAPRRPQALEGKGSCIGRESKRWLTGKLQTDKKSDNQKRPLLSDGWEVEKDRRTCWKFFGQAWRWWCGKVESVRAVGIWGAGGAMPHAPDVGSTVDPISTKGARLCSPYYYRPFPGLLDLPTALLSVCLSVCHWVHSTGTEDFRARYAATAETPSTRVSEHMGTRGHGQLSPLSFDRISIFEFNLSLRSNDVQNFWTLSPPNFETFLRACHGKAEFHQLLGDTWARI
jgi:hypothetical protein